MAAGQQPDDPFALARAPLPQPQPGARRQLEVFGAPLELVLQDERAGRPGRPGDQRPAFQAHRADRIIAAEAIWRAGDVALTPTRFPFAKDQLLLWSCSRRREPSRAMLELALAWEESCGATILGNGMGAAASVTRAHLHVCREQLGFLGALQQEEIPASELHIEPREGLLVLRLSPPFPALCVGLHGPAPLRAAALDALFERRTTPAYSLVSSQGTSWMMPRSGIETPAPHFPQALGSAELWGRWVCNDRETFAALDEEAVAAALAMVGF